MTEERRNNVGTDHAEDSSEPQRHYDESAFKIVWEQLSSNRLELFHQLTRLLSLCFSLFCFLNAVQVNGNWNTRITRYQKALFAGASTHALSMHLSIDNIPESGILSMDYLHCLIYCYIMCSSQPSLVALIPLCSWAILELADYFFGILNDKLSPSHHVVKSITFIRDCRNNLLQLVAYIEIFIAIVIIPWTFITDINFIVLAYYKYIQFRYQSRQKHSRLAFKKVRRILESISEQAQCPDKVKELIQKIVDIVLKLRPLNVPDDIHEE